MQKRFWPGLLAALILAAGLACAARAEEPPEDFFRVPGSVVTFGRYEQDGNEADGPEGIEWIVLEVREGKSLLLSLYGLDNRPYNTADKKITWKDCSLRKWLNSDFLQTAFTPEEQARLPETKEDNSKGQGFKRWKKVKGGKDTGDRVFLLSYTEANRYLGVSWYGGGSDKARMELTEQARRTGARYRTPHFEEEDGTTYWHWWLRSPGSRQNDASKVTASGNMVTCCVASEMAFVRPALWLDLDGTGR